MLSRKPFLNVIGACDGPITMTGQAAQALGIDPAEISVDYVGMFASFRLFVQRVIREMVHPDVIDAGFRRIDTKRLRRLPNHVMMAVRTGRRNRWAGRTGFRDSILKITVRGW